MIRVEKKFKVTKVKSELKLRRSFMFRKDIVSQIYPVKPCAAGATKLLFRRAGGE